MTGFGSSCGACKFLRRKCGSGCVFAPYFSYDQAATHFAAVHKIYGASNVSRLLSHLPILNRSDAAITITYEALARMQDPIYGCVSHIYALQQQVASLQEEIDIIGSLMTNSTIGATNCGINNVEAPITKMEYSNCGIQYPMQDDDDHQCYQNEMANNILSQEGSVTPRQGYGSHMDIELPNNDGNGFEGPFVFYDHPNFNNNNPLEKFLSGIDQEGFMNHP
ncbi:LOB domain-containing protein 33-like [Arachis stenosperma]|uniref:LOB domain-containing protein 33-like n=1 Tax=Arachis stenosperma TaxID=217475 RepID=UPI0025AD619A|nr:LOB domain-containing protein 33-like [Arachis stenosperma]